jgi:hypothetical protein
MLHEYPICVHTGHAGGEIDAANSMFVRRPIEKHPNYYRVQFAVLPESVEFPFGEALGDGVQNHTLDPLVHNPAFDEVVPAFRQWEGFRQPAAAIG